MAELSEEHEINNIKYKYIFSHSFSEYATLTGVTSLIYCIYSIVSIQQHNWVPPMGGTVIKVNFEMFN